MVEKLHTPLPLTSSGPAKAEHYSQVLQDIKLVLQDESDWVAAMATVSSVLHHAFEYFNWTGFYCVLPHQPSDVLVVGPYQGTLGCTRIPFSRGVCGAAARSQQTQLVPDVHGFEGHIACASSTQSEVVVPVVLRPQVAAPAAAAAGAAAEQQPPPLQQQQQQQQPPASPAPIPGHLLAVLDVDSDHPAAFDDVDVQWLESLCGWLADKYGPSLRDGSGPH